MARTLKEIQLSMLEIKNQDPELNALEVLTDDEQSSLVNLTSDSRVSIWRRFLYMIALTIFFFEVLMDEYERRVYKVVDEQRVHTILWYQDLVLKYQHGAVYDSLGNYDNTALTDAQVDTMKVFKHAAITRTINNNAVLLRAKVAGEVNGSFTPATAAQVIAAKVYFSDQADAGTLTTITTGEGDDLLLEMDIYFDPTILDSDGKRLDGENDTPVMDATNQYLRLKELNDSYVKGDHEAALRAVEGIRIAEITKAATKYAQYDYTTANISNAGEIKQVRVADSGYFIVDNAVLSITYIPESNV
jgi:hypothetical protein